MYSAFTYLIAFVDIPGWIIISTIAAISFVSFVTFKCLRKLKFPTKRGIFFYIREPTKLVIINEASKCCDVIKILSKKLENYPLIGLDCEWINDEENKRRPIALIQLATTDGFCVLIRLFKFSVLPANLINLLEDANIIKIGFAITSSDANYLCSDYNVNIAGALDVEKVAQLLNFAGSSLQKLAKNVLNVTLNKDRSIQCSNWETEVLSGEQIRYAALDALIPIKILETMIETRMQKNYTTGTEVYNYLSDVRADVVNSRYEHIPKTKKNSKDNKSEDKIASIAKPFYENCFLQDPDGRTLCVCRNRKIDWYLEKGLGIEVSKSPRVLRLHFEPKNYCRSEDSLYYTMEKENKCVVCGALDSLKRKNIVPCEYRTHFPKVRKDYKSHDVLLLCKFCHRNSVLQDQILRRQLSVKFDAPLSKTNYLTVEARSINKLKYAAKALLNKKLVLHRSRIEELEDFICKQTFFEVITEEILRQIISQNVPKNDSFESHGHKVVRHYEEQNELNQFEIMWRSHFIDTMKPKYMPKLWSVYHNPCEQ